MFWLQTDLTSWLGTLTYQDAVVWFFFFLKKRGLPGKSVQPPVYLQGLGGRFLVKARGVMGCPLPSADRAPGLLSSFSSGECLFPQPAFTRLCRIAKAGEKKRQTQKGGA